MVMWELHTTGSCLGKKQRYPLTVPFMEVGFRVDDIFGDITPNAPSTGDSE